MTLRFGTDGVRGHADELDDHLVAALGRAASVVLGHGSFVVGRDTRQSGPRIEAALTAGLCAGGAAVRSLGVAPTPAVAWACAADGIPGAMISASHNAYADNGIKFFAPGGLKLTDEVEAALEAELDRYLAEPGIAGAGTAESGVAGGLPSSIGPTGLLDGAAPDHRTGADDPIAGYRASLAASIEGRRLDGLRVVVDCANGSASAVAPGVLADLGAVVEVLHADPDGTNINARCGSTHPAELQAAVVASGASVGLAFDGDADRVLAVDERGRLVDGDHLIALCAIDLRQRGALVGDAVVVTVMTNLGFRLSMADRGIDVVETGVGDRQVLEALERNGLALGGEQSGHVIFRRLATTGDGLLTGLQLLDLLVRAGRPLSTLVDESMTRLPQVLVNVRVSRRGLDVTSDIAADIAAVEADLGARGRVLVRPSGTEPLVRVMVEADDEERARAAADRLVAAVGRAVGPA